MIYYWPCILAVKNKFMPLKIVDGVASEDFLPEEGEMSEEVDTEEGDEETVEEGEKGLDEDLA